MQYKWKHAIDLLGHAKLDGRLSKSRVGWRSGWWRFCCLHSWNVLIDGWLRLSFLWRLCSQAPAWVDSAILIELDHDDSRKTRDKGC